MDAAQSALRNSCTASDYTDQTFEKHPLARIAGVISAEGEMPRLRFEAEGGETYGAGNGAGAVMAGTGRVPLFGADA